MSVFVNTGLVNQGLVMAYDMDDRKHGFVGLPTTNQVGTGMGIYNNRGADISVTLNTNGDVYRGAPVYEWKATPTTSSGAGWMTAGNNPGLGVTYGGGGGADGEYTGHSVFVKPLGLMHSAPFFNQYSNIGGWQTNTTYRDMGDGWFQLYTWFEPTDPNRTSDGKYWAFNPLRGVINKTFTCLVAGPFRENENRQTIVSDYTRTSRSATQCLKDLTGNHAPSVANLQFTNSGPSGTFGDIADFAGGQYISENMLSQYRPNTNTIGRTWEIIYKRTGGGDTQGLFGHKTGVGCSYYCNGGIFLSGGTFMANWYDNASYQFMSSGISAVINQYHHVVVTFSDIDQRHRIYVDGILRSTGSATNNNYSGGGVMYDIGWNSKDGGQHYVTGRIPVTRYYYNKVLSDEEVKQNYNALKPRFNLT